MMNILKGNDIHPRCPMNCSKCNLASQTR